MITAATTFCSFYVAHTDVRNEVLTEVEVIFHRKKSSMVLVDGFSVEEEKKWGEKVSLYFSIILKNIRVKTFLSSGVDTSHISLSNSSSGVAGQTFSDRKFAKASDIC